MKYLREYHSEDMSDIISDVLSSDDLDFEIRRHENSHYEIVLYPISNENNKLIEFFGEISNFFTITPQDTPRYKDRLMGNRTVSRVCKLSGLELCCVGFFRYNMVQIGTDPIHGIKLLFRQSLVKESIPSYSLNSRALEISDSISDVLFSEDLDFKIVIKSEKNRHEFAITFYPISNENKEFIKFFNNIGSKYPFSAFKNIIYQRNRRDATQKNPIISRICQLTGLMFSGFYQSVTSSLSLYFESRSIRESKDLSTKDYHEYRTDVINTISDVLTDSDIEISYTNYNKHEISITVVNKSEESKKLIDEFRNISGPTKYLIKNNPIIKRIHQLTGLSLTEFHTNSQRFVILIWGLNDTTT